MNRATYPIELPPSLGSAAQKLAEELRDLEKQGKPEAAVGRIVEGKLNGWY